MAKRNNSGCSTKREKACKGDFLCSWNPDTKKCGNNYLPYILGGAAIALGAIVALSRRASASPGQNQILGCTNPKATNFDPLANVDDGSCVFSQPGICTPGKTRNETFCPDGVTLKEFEECNSQGDAYVKKTNQCAPPPKTCVLGEKRNQAFCWDGTTLKSWEECTDPANNTFTLQTAQCPPQQICTPTTRRNIKFCPDGITPQSYEECNAQGTGYTNVVSSCPTPQQCSLNGQRICRSNNVLEECQNGQWVAIASCRYCPNIGGTQCINNVLHQCNSRNILQATSQSCGSTQCTGNQSICRSNNVLEQCQNGNWVQIASCQYCANPGSTKCINNQVFQCNSNNALVPTSQSCGTNQCTSGPTRCDPNNPAYVQKCVNGKYVYDQRCPHGCAGGKCKAPSVCNNGTFRCWNNRVRQKCVGGQWKDDQVCIYGCRPDGSCRACSHQDEKNGLKRCIGRNVEQCIDGSWKGIKTCANQCTGLGNCT